MHFVPDIRLVRRRDRGVKEKRPAVRLGIRLQFVCKAADAVSDAEKRGDMGIRAHVADVGIFRLVQPRRDPVDGFAVLPKNQTVHRDAGDLSRCGMFQSEIPAMRDRQRRYIDPHLHRAALILCDMRPAQSPSAVGERAGHSNRAVSHRDDRCDRARLGRNALI